MRHAPYAGLWLLGLSLVMTGAGAFIPVLGLLIAAMAPNVFLAGVAIVSFSLMHHYTKRIGIAVASAVAITILTGVNSRLPAVVADMRQANYFQLSHALQGSVGQPIYIESNTSQLLGRTRPYASVGPACYGDGCFITRGFRPPQPGLLMDYWREDVSATVLAAGFSKASAGERAPRITISESRDADTFSLTLELLDADGASLARFIGTFRNGYPLETTDGSGNIRWPAGAFEYLLHANSISYWFSRWTRPPEQAPLETFLKRASSLSHPQVGETSNVTEVSLEILSEKVYEPVWILKNHDDGKTKWADLAFDKEREDVRCKTMLRPESPGASLYQGWVLFAADPAGRKKMRFMGTVICERESLWFFDTGERGRMLLTKYTPAGDLLYQVSFDKPGPIYGFDGHIMTPTFEAKGGYLSFEWWNTNQSGVDRHIRRAMKVRFAEPK